ncbi:type IV secretory system conjugative DNA transfer family protein [Zavarzinella formosa]|uniref:type IV secretory system conjugative DNA transfer family protein n=1 Tax=Zavarzinella formosa TaxID=360055 RepID=UPI000306E7FB|nr:type IV secretory system conjugative DNA transfer family protein [Zavarzinella formosa]
MKLIRRLLIASVIIAAFDAVMMLVLFRYLWVAALVVCVAMCLRETRRSSDAFGSARFASPQELLDMTESNQEPIIGHIQGKITRRQGLKALFDRRLEPNKGVRRFLASCQRRQHRKLVRLKDAVHVAVFAPTGVGKGVSIVIPHLRTSADSMVVVDFKGELFRETADARRKMGHRVVCLDPFGVAGGTDTFNPMMGLSESHFALDECNDLAQEMVVRTGKEHDEHWNDSAQSLISALLGVTAIFADEDDKHLQSMRGVVSDDQKLEVAISSARNSPAWGGMIARAGHQLAQLKDRERASVLSTAHRHLRFLDTPAVAVNTRASTFDPAELCKGKMTVYLVLPPDHMRAQSGLLRLWIGSLLRVCVKNGLQEKSKVRFILDEAASLGPMDAITDAVDKYRGYGVRLLFLYQSLGQLKKCWPGEQDQTLLSNVTQIYFGINDYQTAEQVSKMLGESTITISSGGTGSSKSQPGSGDKGGASYSTSASNNWQFGGRSLMRPDELLNLDKRVAITFMPGYRPISTWLCRSYESDFQPEREMGVLKAAFDSVCMFLTVTIIAAMVTACVFDLK